MDRKTLQKISYGVYIVSSKKGDKLNGQIANTVFQVTSEPPEVAASICKQNLTHEYIRESGVFAISILSTEAPMKFIGTFGFHCGREIDKFGHINYKVGKTGAPIVLEYTIGYIECEVIGSLDAGTHTIFLGKVIEAQQLNSDEPMTYAFYHNIKGGLSPKAAPTYIKE
ncbi:MAG: flavin reductase family protein [Thermodesulfovibrionales bacterium]|jgi:ferric-chelate reductase [NAD(P)H]